MNLMQAQNLDNEWYFKAFFLAGQRPPGDRSLVFPSDKCLNYRTGCRGTKSSYWISCSLRQYWEHLLYYLYPFLLQIWALLQRHQVRHKFPLINSCVVNLAAVSYIQKKHTFGINLILNFDFFEHGYSTFVAQVRENEKVHKSIR